jgi:hypothetical protein
MTDFQGCVIFLIGASFIMFAVIAWYVIDIAVELKKIQEKIKP